MITVRFPSGFSVQYNNGGYVSQDSTYAFRRVYPSKEDAENNRRIIAWVPAEAIIEFVQPCLTYMASDPNMPDVSATASLERKVKALTSAVNKLSKK
jgi:hypothetical protein